MPSFAFRGGPVLTLDAKGRLTVPSRYRDVLMSTVEGQMVISKNHAGCLTLFPRPVWDSFEQELVRLPMKHEGWRRLYIGSATDVEIDSGSRVLVPPELRAWAGLGKDLMLVGMGSRMEIWDRERYLANENLTLSQPMPDGLRNMVM